MKESTRLAIQDTSRISAIGTNMGRQLSSLADKACIRLADEYGEADERCSSCAFRQGTVPNQCIQTLADAAKCLAEKLPFRCHCDDNHDTVCHGWYAISVFTREAPKRTAPWQFSDPDPGEEELLKILKPKRQKPQGFSPDSKS